MLILQPQSKHNLLYSFLRAHQIPITQAKLCKEAGKRYLAFRAGADGDLNMTVEDLLYLAHDPLFPEYLDFETQRITRALIGMEHAARNMEQEKEALRLERDYLTRYEKAVEAW